MSLNHYKQTVAKIRELFYAESDPHESDLASVHAAYAAAVNATNERLRHCDELLASGHRNEALQSCEIAPNLLECVGVLDFAERDQWDDYIAQFNLSAAPELLIEIAADLNAAYTSEQPLGKLMRRHRLHALARSPLNRRIAVMRQIARVDRDNPIWGNDLAVFEKARQSELPNEVAMAVRKNDLHALSQLEQEVRDPQWLEPPSKSLVDHTVEAHTRLRAKQARGQLAQLEQSLTQAFADFDAVLGRQLRDQWNARAAIADLPPEDPLQERVAPALEWLAEQDRQEREQQEYAAALSALERALDDAAPRSDLERLYHAVVRFDREIPLVLARRLTERLDYLDTSEARKSRLVLASVVMAVLLVGSLTAVGIQRHLRATELATHVTNARVLLDHGRLDDVTKYLDDLKSQAPHVLDSPEGRQLQSDFAAALAVENGRRAQREQAIAAARVAGIDAPTWDSLPRALESLDEAAALSVTELEHAEVRRMQQRVHEVRDQRQAAENDAFMELLSDFQDRLRNLDQHDLEGMKQLLAEAAAIEKREHVTAELTNLVEPLAAQLRAMRNREMELRGTAGLFERITGAVGNRQRFQSRLQEFVSQYGATQLKRAADFERVLNSEAELWSQFEQWRALLDGAARLNVTMLSAAEASQFVADVEPLLQQQSAMPAASRLKELRDYAAAVARRETADGEKLHLEIVATLNNPTVANLFVVVDQAERRFYCAQQPVFIGGTCAVRYFTGFDLSKTGIQRFSEDEVANPRSGPSIVWEAPQSEFRRQALDHLTRMRTGTWESTFSSLLTQLQDHARMDPILKLQLFDRVLETASAGSVCIERAYARHREVLRSTPLDPNVNWLDPNDVAGQTARVEAARIVERLPAAKPTVEALEVLVAGFRDSGLGPEWKWYGWLHRDRSGEDWICSSPQLPMTRPTHLYIVLKDAADAPVTVQRVGETVDGHVKISADNPALLVEGRPVFSQRVISESE